MVVKYEINHMKPQEVNHDKIQDCYMEKMRNEKLNLKIGLKCQQTIVFEYE